MTKDSKWLSHLQLMSRSEINVRTYMDEQQGNCEKAAQQLFDVFWQEVSADGRFSVLQF
jgi:hypothetical protein